VLAHEIELTKQQLSDTELCLVKLEDDECLDEKELIISREAKKIRQALHLMAQAQSILRDLPDKNESTKNFYSQRAIDYAAKFVGTSINRWFVKDIVIDPENRPEGIYYRADCQCGKESIVLARSIRNGNIRSCGCSRVKLSKSKKSKKLSV
jgi:hypothetical protein